MQSSWNISKNLSIVGANLVLKYDATSPTLTVRLAVSTLLPVLLFLRANCLPTC